MMITFLPWYSRFQNMKSDQNIATRETFYTEVINFFYVNIFKTSENSLKICKKMLKSHIHVCKFHQAVFKKFRRSQISSNIVFKDSFGILNIRWKQVSSSF